MVAMLTVLTSQVLTDRLDEIAAQREALNLEEAEIRAALNVLNRYGAQSITTTPEAESSDERSEPSDKEPKLGPARPEGTPTLFQMAYEVISDAEQRGEPGLSGQGIVEAIGAVYWPGVQGPQILPSIYQFAKRGRLQKSENGLFTTGRTKEAPADYSEGASQATEEAPTSSTGQTGGSLADYFRFPGGQTRHG